MQGHLPFTILFRICFFFQEDKLGKWKGTLYKYHATAACTREVLLGCHDCKMTEEHTDGKCLQYYILSVSNVFKAAQPVELHMLLNTLFLYGLSK